MNVSNAVWMGPETIQSLQPGQPGSYVLLVGLESQVVMRAGKLPEREYPAGWYAYTGSALGGLKARLLRYLDPGRKRRWHIDYLLERGRVDGALIIRGAEKLECRLAAALGEKLETIYRFGSSDCRCPGHLFYHPDRAYIIDVITKSCP